MFPANVNSFFPQFRRDKIKWFFCLGFHQHERLFSALPWMRLKRAWVKQRRAEGGVAGGDRVSLALGTRRNRRLCPIDAVDNKNRTESICCSRTDCAYAVCAHTLRGSEARIQKAAKVGSTVRAAWSLRCESSQPKYSQHLYIEYSPHNSEFPEIKNRKATRWHDETNLIIKPSRDLSLRRAV